ncbi:hypothetical protein H7347_09760 [Corynebacterium sp. zg-331]|uniref:hypothetical protein n=1 Tax=unclassified Corynebacterium TaxID=2624378 RepID=UPI00128D3B98|nr:MULTISPECIES: hypothetical protein [unclassified Corynebacterium]MBC3186845.1 hypothetical protein [Corynebacterium sp. zg-331]MPV53325.1 hypothetical protein [Corynebacterium sp. zg331]
MSEEELSRVVAEAEEGYPLEDLEGGQYGAGAVLMDLPRNIRVAILGLCAKKDSTPRQVIAQILTEHFSRAA